MTAEILATRQHLYGVDVVIVVACVWWMQNMPQSGSGQTYADGSPMPGFWPFMFY